MSRYNTFLLVFILSVVAFIVFMVTYLNAIFGLAFHIDDHSGPDPFELLANIFSPEVLISGLVLGLSSLAYRILGIVYVAKNKTVSDGEKAIWIVGFVIMGFITGIVFLVMAKGRKFVD